MNNSSDHQNNEPHFEPVHLTPNKTAQNYAIASLILGILSLASNLWCITGLPILLGIVAFIMAHLSKQQNNGIRPKYAGYGIGLGIAGTVLGGIVLIVSIILRFILSLGFSAMWRSLLKELFQYINSSEAAGALLH